MLKIYNLIFFIKIYNYIKFIINNKYDIIQWGLHIKLFKI